MDNPKAEMAQHLILKYVSNEHITVLSSLPSYNDFIGVHIHKTPHNTTYIQRWNTWVSSDSTLPTSQCPCLTILLHNLKAPDRQSTYTTQIPLSRSKTFPRFQEIENQDPTEEIFRTWLDSSQPNAFSTHQHPFKAKFSSENFSWRSASSKILTKVNYACPVPLPTFTLELAKFFLGVNCP